MNNELNPLPTHQNGSVLIVALIMLLLLTIIGLASIRGTSLQENMASNLRDSSIAFMDAETALREGQTEARNWGLEIMLGARCPETGESITASNNRYEITLLGCTPASTDLSDTSIGDVLLRVQALGAGQARDDSNNPQATVSLRSSYRTAKES